MKVLFLTADFGGNVPPTIAVAEAVASRGHQVEVAGLAPGRTSLPQADFRPASAIGTHGTRNPVRQVAAMVKLMFGPGIARSAAALAIERRADVIVVDCMAAAPLKGAITSDTPVVVLFHTFGTYWVRSFDRGPMGLAFRVFGIRPRSLWARAARRLLITDHDLDPGRDDPTLADFTWTGTSELGAEPRPHGPRPRVLVALSSTDWPGMLPVYRRIVSALSQLKVDAIVTTGGAELGGELIGADNVTVHRWVPHSELLPTMDLVISHGGHSTTMKVLSHGIPLLIMPINPTSDQALIGQALSQASLGASLKKSASVASIREAVVTILGDQRVRSTAAETGRRLREASPGAEVAADLITTTARTDT